MTDDVTRLLTGHHRLRIGESFAPTPKYSYNALRYDFKPASIDPNSPSTLAVSGNEVTITSEGEKAQATVFKGNKRPCQKEGILVFDPATGECTLERLNNILQVKKSRDVAPRTVPQINPPSETSLDSSPKHSGSEKKQASSKVLDAKRSAALAGSSKKPSPGHMTSSTTTSKSSQSITQSRVSAPSGRINILKDDLNLSESSDDD